MMTSRRCVKLGVIGIIWCVVVVSRWLRLTSHFWFIHGRRQQWRTDARVRSKYYFSDHTSNSPFQTKSIFCQAFSVTQKFVFFYSMIIKKILLFFLILYLFRSVTGLDKSHRGPRKHQIWGDFCIPNCSWSGGKREINISTAKINPVIYCENRGWGYAVLTANYGYGIYLIHNLGAPKCSGP